MIGVIGIFVIIAIQSICGVKNMNSQSEIIRFWFGDEADARKIADSQSKLWWSKNADADREITRRFEADTMAVYHGTLANLGQDWLESPQGYLASILCLDQFPRNMYRENAKSFAYDVAARMLAKNMLSAGFDGELPAIQRVFVYLPFEHSEDLQDQNRSVELYENLLAVVPSEEKKLFQGYVDFAIRHREIILQFARFPHRNKILGRESTADETIFLTQAGSSF